MSDGCGMSFCYCACLLYSDNFRFRFRTNGMVSSATCEPCDVDLKRKKRTLFDATVCAVFVFEKSLRIHIH